MSYFGKYMLYCANRNIDDIIEELQKIKKENPGCEIRTTYGICDNECDMYGECTCDVVGIEVIKKEKVK